MGSYAVPAAPDIRLVTTVPWWFQLARLALMRLRPREMLTRNVQSFNVPAAHINRLMLMFKGT